MRTAVILGLSAAILFGGACGSSGGKPVLKIGWVLPEEHPSSKALEFFAQRMEELVGDHVEVRLFPNGVLGDATVCAESVRAGNLEMALLSAAPLSQFVKEFNVLTMPFLFRDSAHQYAVVDGEIGAELRGMLEPVGMDGLGFFDAGSRNVMTKSGPIASPADLAGLRIRVMTSKLMVDTLNAMGASATAMGQGEVYSALQTGVLDGWENNPPTALTFRMHETGCTHFAWTRHLAVPDVIVMNRDFRAGLDRAVRDAIDQAVAETIEKQRVLWRDAEGRAVAALEEAGMVFTEVDRAPFAARVEPLYEEYFAKHGADFARLCRAIRAM